MNSSNHRVAIITHPLQYNYGGVLQAFALNTVLSRYCKEVVVLRNFNYTVKDYAKLCWEQIQPYHRFKHKYLNEVRIPFDRLEECLQRMRIDTVVVGSDQVWRPDFAMNNYTFGQFLTGRISINLLAYAASFGTDDWEYTDKQEIFLQKEILKFSNISVREDSGCNLCKKHLGVEAQLVVDPTLLLEDAFYLNLIKGKKKNDFKECFCYLLDSDNLFNERVIRAVIDNLNLNLRQVSLIKNRMLKRFLPTLSIPDWLAGIYNADFVITDSFHGCIFCILFKKNFLVLENVRGGNARIESLLRLFRIENRLIRQGEMLNLNNLPMIDWSIVDEILKEQREKSYSFLMGAMNIKYDTCR